MNSKKVDRRQVIFTGSGVALGLFVPGATGHLEAQQPGYRFRPSAFGQIHNTTLKGISSALDKIPIDSQDGLGLHKIVDLLVKNRLITAEEGQTVHKLIDSIVASKTIDEMTRRVQAIYDEILNKAGDVVVVIASVARSSISYARELSGNPDFLRIARVVARDVLGALTGAAACMELGPYGAAIGALAGAVAGSAEAALGSNK
jgi:hypothetical protein